MVCYIVVSQTLQHRNREVIMVWYIVVSQNNNTETGRLSWCVILWLVRITTQKQGGYHGVLYCDKSDVTTQKQGGYHGVLYCDKSDFTTLTQKQGGYHGVLYCG